MTFIPLTFISPYANKIHILIVLPQRKSIFILLLVVLVILTKQKKYILGNMP